MVFSSSRMPKGSAFLPRRAVFFSARHLDLTISIEITWDHLKSVLPIPSLGHIHDLADILSYILDPSAVLEQSLKHLHFSFFLDVVH